MLWSAVSHGSKEAYLPKKLQIVVYKCYFLESNWWEILEEPSSDAVTNEVSLQSFFSCILGQSWFRACKRPHHISKPLFIGKAKLWADKGQQGKLWELAVHASCVQFLGSNSQLIKSEQAFSSNKILLAFHTYILTSREIIGIFIVLCSRWLLFHRYCFAGHTQVW